MPQSRRLTASLFIKTHEIMKEKRKCVVVHGFYHYAGLAQLAACPKARSTRPVTRLVLADSLLSSTGYTPNMECTYGCSQSFK
eukprot:1149868-Pelagomonas_calceolata.AAC.3